MPWKTTHWNSRSDYFTIGPLVRGGFITLLNPSVTSTSSGAATTGSTSASVTNGNFSSAYYFLGFGTRLAWERYSRDTNEGSQTLSEFLVTIGDYSNLPSYVCKPTTGTSNPYAPGSTTIINTACSLSQYPVTAPSGSTTTYSYYADFRTVRPRFDIEGFAMLPGYPFILGIDANLQQSYFGSKSNLDFLNKPGNDIRIYIGVKIDLGTLISKL